MTGIERNLYWESFFFLLVLFFVHFSSFISFSPLPILSSNQLFKYSKNQPVFKIIYSSFQEEISWSLHFKIFTVVSVLVFSSIASLIFPKNVFVKDTKLMSYFSRFLTFSRNNPLKSKPLYYSINFEFLQEYETLPWLWRP